MTKLTSKVPGMQVWAYDYSNRPDKTPSRNTPKTTLGYNNNSLNYDGVFPVTQQPTEFVGENINEYQFIFDNKHVSNGTNIKQHVIGGSVSDLNHTMTSLNNRSFVRWMNTMFQGDEYIYQSDTTATRDVNYSSFTTKTPGINLIYQTGIVPDVNGRSAIIFEVEPGYKIPKGNAIQITPAFNGNNGKYKKLFITYDISPGIYEIATSLDTTHNWTTADIDFATVVTQPVVPQKPHSKITFNLTHCTVSPNDTDVENGVHSWTFTAETGYTFKYSGGVYNENDGEFGNEIPATNTNVTHLNNYTIPNDTTIGLTAYPDEPVVPQIPHAKITFQLLHCTVSPNETDVEIGVHSWTFTAETGYVFKYGGGVYDNFNGEFGNEIPATNTNVTHLNNYTIPNDTTIGLTAYPEQSTTIAFEQTLTHARSNVTSNTISRTLNAISLTADIDYLFKTPIQILFYSEGQVVSEYNVDGNNTDNITIPLNTTTANTITSNMDKVKMIASATLTTSHAGYEHNYLITETELNSFSNDKIWNNADVTKYTASQYIDNLIELPFKVDTPTTVNKISVGSAQSNITSHETNERFVTLDLGTINVPAKYNNGYDYQNKTIKLYTPFVPPITIDNDNAINKTISISYKIDISNGNLTINLYNDNILFFTGTNNIDSKIPFLNAVKNTVIKQDNHFNDNDIRQPYIVVSRETPILNSAYYPTSERGIIKNYNGNIQVHLLNNMNIPNDELSELTNLLESGAKYVKSN